MKLKFLTAIALLTFFYQEGKAQEIDSANKIRLEAGWGYNLPASPTSGITASDFAGIRSFYGGIKYEVDDLWGVRGTYAYNSFQHKDDGLDIHKLMLEGTFNIIEATGSDLGMLFEVEAHGGLGVSVAKSKVRSGSDKMFNVQLGIMPQYKITERVSILLDVTYVVNLGQNYNYAGVHARKDKQGTTGGYLTTNLGVAVKF